MLKGYSSRRRIQTSRLSNRQVHRSVYPEFWDLKARSSLNAML
ncbi:hypothetical protein BDA96_02G401300 [Sorghum bicolor]|uniref:Uncharacterized protein n=2 Tax=Sorghum bicolor TaxID=4558 RepID=A0A921RSX0_SORBI|nr:hypothetical protein BDA96_02G401300 [Sorghum bicolor]KXG36747.1 hypothetical protein SORBI_3002G382400 [Sorghum bicolor]